jgi:DNA-binding transcriptional LysR family regulator
MTQPALSNALNRLRELMRDPLFVRERYGMRPTEKALELAPIIAAALGQFDAVVLGQQDFEPRNAKRHFTIAASSYAEFVLLPALAARLRIEAPQITLHVVPYSGELLEAGIISGSTAMAIGRVADPPDNVVVQSLMEDSLQCIVRFDHPDVGESLSREQYERLRHVNHLPPGRLRFGLFQVLERHGLHRDVAVSVTHFLAVPEVIAATDYCATLPSAICRRLVQDRRFRSVAPPVDLGTFTVQVAWHTRYRQDPAHRWLRALLAELAREALPQPT